MRKIVVEESQTRKTIVELFEGYDEEYASEEMDWGEPVGAEFW